MSDQINQIQATFNAFEDRILLKFKTLNDHVYQAWVTRRFCKLLLPALHGLHPVTGESLFDLDNAADSDDADDRPQLTGDYSNEYEAPENPTYPLGEEPILLAKIRFQDLDKELATFILEPHNGQGLVLPFHPDLIGPMLKIISEAVDNAEWDLGQEMGVPKSQMLQ